MKGAARAAATRRPRTSESGYAMLFVFVLAAAIAITLIMEMPRFMFERQREKEQLLIDRGEQYSLAIRRYYAKFQRWPTTMDDLENTNNLRFLRRQYKDPMTGKADWRIIHEAAGVLTDSLVHPAPTQPNATNTPGTAPNATFGTLTSSNPVASSMTASSGDTSSQQPPPKAPGLLFRPSDRGPLGTAHGGVSPDQDPMAGFDSNDQGATVPPYAPENTPPSDAAPPGQNPEPANPNPGQISNPGQNPSPGQILNPAQNPNPGQSFNPVQGQNPGQVPLPPGFGPAGPVPGGGPNPVLNQILQNLFGPRQFPNGAPAAATQNQPLSGGGTGIAGVASKAEFEGIKRYRDQSAYNKWEFTYDMSTLQQQQQQQQQQLENSYPNSPFRQQQPPQQGNPPPNTNGGTTPNL